MHDGLPPGPRLPAPVQAALALRHGPRLVAGCRRRYGKVFTLRVAGVGTLVYLADPADIHTVFAGDPRIFHAGKPIRCCGGCWGTPRSWSSTKTCIGTAAA